MAGLDTRGAFDGFVQGFGLMQNFQNGQERKALANRQMEMQQRGLDMRHEEMAASRDMAERRFGLDERQMDLQGKRFDQQMSMDEKRYGLDERRVGIADKQFERQMSADNRRLGLQERELGMREHDRQQERDTQVIRGAYAKIAENVDLGDDELAAFKRMPWLSPAHVADDRMSQAVARAAKVFDPNDPADANDPQSLEAINYMFGPRVSRGEGGQKKIVGVYPGQTKGTLAFELEVTGEDGKPYRAPMTKNRGTADDDEVMQIPIEDVVNQVAGYKTLSGVLQHTGSRERAVALGQRLGMLDQYPGGAKPSAARQKYDELRALGETPDNAMKLAYGGMPKASDQIKQQERQEEIGAAYEQSGHVLAAVDDLLSETGQQGLNSASGMSSLVWSRPGGEAYNAELKLEQLTSMLQLENMGVMKGVLSDSDMKVIRAASSGLDIGLSTDQINQRLESIRGKLQSARDRTAGKAQAQGVNLEPYGGASEPAERPVNGAPSAGEQPDFSSLWGG